MTLSSVIILISFIFYIKNTPPRPPKPKLEPMVLPDKAPPLPHKGEIPPFANFFITSILIIGFDTGLIFYTKWMEAEQKKLQIEKESIENKMAFLRNQISPHFFMNTLNNIHALVDIDTEQAKDAIIMLSHLMNYLLYESQTETVLLEKELNFIKSYIALMRLRYTNNVDIKLSLPPIIPKVNIPPLLTISFIENTFKHGISYHNPSFIYIEFKITENKIQFFVKNTIHSQPLDKGKNSGIGLKNIQNRLKLIYGEDYNLSLNKENNIFKVYLEVPI